VLSDFRAIVALFGYLRHHDDMAKYWLLNPSEYPRLLASKGHIRFCWERPHLDKRRIDHALFASTVLRGVPYEYLVMEKFGVAEYRSGFDTHTAMYPVWDYTQSFTALVDMVQRGAIGKGDLSSIPASQRPRPGQPHRIIITGVPDAGNAIAKKFYLELKDLGKDYEDVEFVIHRVTSYRIAFGLGFYGAITDPYPVSKKGNIVVPSGQVIKNTLIDRYPKWCKMFGFTTHELKASPEKRLSYNLQSLDFAALNFNKLIALKDGAAVTESTDIPTSEMTYPELRTSRPLATSRGILPAAGDKIECNSCSLKPDCKYAREGAVCSLPGTDGRSLAHMFRTRDSQQILIGLSSIVGKQAERLERALQEEESFGDINPDVSKLAGQVFNQGAQLAKLVDPELRGGTKVQVNVGGGGAAAVTMGNKDPKQYMAEVIRELENQGFARADITPALIERFITTGSAISPTKAIDARRTEIIADDDDYIEGEITHVDPPENPGAPF
jgi:hypothetical protein